MDVEILRNNEFSSGDKIRIIDGPLCGYEGILIEIKGKKKFGVSISCVNLINPEKPDVPLNKNDAFQKVQKRHVQEKR